MSFVETILFDKILAETPFSAGELSSLLVTAPNRYKEHDISKRHDRGTRRIAQPTAELKLVQRAIVPLLFSQLSLSEAATGYRRGKSIIDHADPHKHSKYLLKLDFRDFFPSIKKRAIERLLNQKTELSEEEIWLACQVLCKRNSRTRQLELSIGSPSSPAVSNHVLTDFDTAVTGYCENNSMVYTRYADDIAISTSEPHTLDIVKKYIDRLLARDHVLSLVLNEEKTVNVSRKNNRTLTGLTLTNQGYVSVGRNRKRKLRALVHKYSLGQLDHEETESLRGNLAFLLSIDPAFVHSLLSRHSIPHVSHIRYLESV